ncbi:hypothetical protein P152DRAFT_446334 [Eremomyces bilateralis CBS 781.70]|uniref:Zn(2)-C6 fungal-type domain-containing protein n=1 Tax=Eremomyces bilateralis CBS 781.70 TaxID=1392243 RepID=A0A6G1GF73_9PEZI|nr:uncharacterized protein P152DRAFT_446334 [Eremomyces bilateralis CBS 781.70]KAF1816718.1 hypothetical protein P152DRAFT_446334 [Eremomyces bilateralis CBS 781.70]
MFRTFSLGSQNEFARFIYQSDDPAGSPQVAAPLHLACNCCRSKKLRCTGEKPQCHRCRTKGVDCVYALPRERRRKTKDESRYHRRKPHLRHVSTPSLPSALSQRKDSAQSKPGSSGSESKIQFPISNDVPNTPSGNYSDSSSIYEEPLFTDLDGPSDFSFPSGTFQNFTSIPQTTSLPGSYVGDMFFDPFTLGRYPLSNPAVNDGTVTPSIPNHQGTMPETPSSVSFGLDSSTPTPTAKPLSGGDLSMDTPASNTPYGMSSLSDITPAHLVSSEVIDVALAPPQHQPDCACIKDADQLLREVRNHDPQSSTQPADTTLTLLREAMNYSDRVLSCPTCSQTSASIMMMVQVSGNLVRFYEGLSIKLAKMELGISEGHEIAPAVGGASASDSTSSIPLRLGAYELESQQECFSIVRCLVSSQMEKMTETLSRMASLAQSQGWADPSNGLMTLKERLDLVARHFWRAPTSFVPGNMNINPG